MKHAFSLACHAIAHGAKADRMQGFSLVELSIVLVILGLLTGGILTGQNLIRAAELRSVTTEFNTYQTAVMTFRDKYFYLPGDMPNATDFWGAISSTPATCIATASPDHRATCNGDGDGYVNKQLNYALAGYERYHFWLHLANADLIEGSYTGVTATAGTFSSDRSVNVPAAKIGSGQWEARSAIADWTSASHAQYFSRVYSYNVLLTLASETLMPEELWAVDVKLDDGMPATGRIFTFKSTGSWEPGCALSDDIDTKYNVASKDKICGFRAGF